MKKTYDSKFKSHMALEALHGELTITEIASKYQIHPSESGAANEYRPAEFRVNLSAEMEVLIPGRSEPLIRKRTVSGSANYQYNVDPQVGRYYGLRQACYDLGGQIVEYTTEAW